MIVTLVPGDMRRPLFVIPGAGGEARELAALASALPGGRAVVAIAPDPADATVEAMGARAAAAMREQQPHGPWSLLGYSFGGLVAVEAARALEGEVAFLGLVDAVYDRRWWPRTTFAAALLRRTGAHLARIGRGSWRDAAPELARRAGGLVRRLAARAAASERPGLPSAERTAFTAMAAWRPSSFPTPAVFFASRAGADFGCDPAGLWRRHVRDLTVHRVQAGHLELVRDPVAVADLARAIDAALVRAEAGRPVRVLMACSFNWISTSRLALGLNDAGFAVSAVCPAGHSLPRLGLLAHVHRLDPLRPQASLRDAIAAARPDLVLPCDDRIVQTLHALHAAADPETPAGSWLRGRLAASLGPPVVYPWVYSRAALMALAEEEGVRRPPTVRVRSLADLAAWRADHPGPAVLKTDGSWGGREVMRVDEPVAAARAFRRLVAPPSLLRALKRLVADGDVAPIRAALRRQPASVSVQAFVPGAPANSAVACLNGEVLAAVHVEVVQSDGPTGPATVVRVIEHAEMDHAVRALVRRLGLSGLCGFDFILDGEAAHLIELNPRATPTAHLAGADGSDLLAALNAGLRRATAPRRGAARHGRVVALFPQELRRDPVSAFLRSAHHDIPWHAPQLVEIALAETQGPRAALDRAIRRLAARA